MSDSLLVFITSSELPTVQELRERCSEYGLELEEWDNPLQDIVGFWPAYYQSQQTGFEFFLSESEEQDLGDWGVTDDELDGRDQLIELAYQSETDALASIICAVALCELADGITFDENDRLHISAANCLEWAEEQGVVLAEACEAD